MDRKYRSSSQPMQPPKMTKNRTLGWSRQKIWNREDRQGVLRFIPLQPLPSNPTSFPHFHSSRSTHCHFRFASLLQSSLLPLLVNLCILLAPRDSGAPSPLLNLLDNDVLIYQSKGKYGSAKVLSNPAVGCRKSRSCFPLSRFFPN